MQDVHTQDISLESSSTTHSEIISFIGPVRDSNAQLETPIAQMFQNEKTCLHCQKILKLHNIKIP